MAHHRIDADEIKLTHGRSLIVIAGREGLKQSSNGIYAPPDG